MINFKWDSRFLEMADTISRWSKDPSTKVGAIIVSPEKRVVSLGYNGFAKSVADTDSRYNDRYNQKYLMTVHAEVNAILFADRHLLVGSTLYVYPLLPCARCAAIIIQSGISRVVCVDSSEKFDKSDDHLRWEIDFNLGKKQFEEAGVELSVIA